MADKLGLGPEIKELRLGSSFTNKGSAFHTFRYDFKPASVDTSKMATVDILQNNEVNVTVPHCDGAGTAQTSVFRGPKKPYAKDCVLIIDHSTGEITLERLSHNIQLKKTRPARSSSPVETGLSQQAQSLFSQSRKISPARKSSPASSTSPTASSPPASLPHASSLPSSSLTTVRSSPKYPTFGSATKKNDNRENRDTSVGTSLPGSMPLIGDLGFMPVAPPQEDTALVGVLSESSSDSGSDSSSNSSESDSDSDLDKAPIPVANGRVASPKVAAPSNPSATHLSMPTNLLSEDLELSDSGSDSD